MSMKKIAIVTDNIKRSLVGGVKYGGGYVVSQHLIFELAQRDDVELTVFTEAGSYEAINNVNVVEIPYSRKNKEFLLEIERHIQSQAYDIVLSVNVCKLFINPILQGHSFIYRCYNNFFLFSLIKKILGAVKIKKQSMDFSRLPASSKFFAVSSQVRSDYVRHFGLNENNVHVVYPACEQIFPEYPVISKEKILTIGSVANSSLNKGGHFLILALGLVKLAGYKFNLKLIAPKYKKDLLMQFLIKVFGLAKMTEILPAQKDMSEFYSKINLLVLPSLVEAFGLVVLEAMSFGIPSLVSSTAGVSEILDDSNGFLFNRSSLKDCVLKIKFILDSYYNDFDLFKKYSYNAYQTSKNYTWQKFAQCIIDKF